MSSVISVDQADRPDEFWDDPVRGSLRWRTLFSGDRTATDSLVCGIADIRPGEHFALHSHPESEVYFGLEGEGTVIIDGAPHRLAPGVALFIPGNAVHGVPHCTSPMRWFYTFARDRFDQIHYSFAHEAPGATTPTTDKRQA